MAEAPAGCLPWRKKLLSVLRGANPCILSHEHSSIREGLPPYPKAAGFIWKLHLPLVGALTHLPVALAAHSLHPPSSFTTAPSRIFLYQSCVSSSLVHRNYTHTR